MDAIVDDSSVRDSDLNKCGVLAFDTFHSLVNELAVAAMMMEMTTEGPVRWAAV